MHYNHRKEQDHMMFIAIENMGSAYGYKSKNTENKQPADHGGKGQRMIKVQNKETWSEQFRIHQDCFKPDRDHDTFHVLFAGCSTGNLTKLSHKHLTNVVAKTLAKLFQCNVNAYGTDKTIENDEILHILTNIETIKGGATGVSGTYVLNERQNINLDWVKRHN
jgi:hypothetical protein